MTQPHFYRGLSLGILGGGQLGRMLIQSAIDFNIHTAVLDYDDASPCRHAASRFVQGLVTDYDQVLDFGRSVDILTIEVENVNVEALETLEREGKAIFPQPAIIRTIQDKGTQKSFFDAHHIPTAPYAIIDRAADIYQYKNLFPAVQKLRRAGYDGKGVVMLDTPESPGAFSEPSILETRLPFEKEISVLVARGRSGETVAYPTVEMQFHPTRHLVEYLICPARLAANVEKEAQALAIRIADALQIVGLLAVEMFVMPGGEVLVNELAPRPHNSGHHTIEAISTSQFEQHLRAIAGLPLGSTAIVSPSVMINVLGDDGFTGPVVYEGIDQVVALEGVHLHLYGKVKTAPFRKMGHITILNHDMKKAIQTADLIKTTLKVRT